MKNLLIKTSHVVLPATLTLAICLGGSTIAQQKKQSSYGDQLDMIRLHHEKGDGQKLAAALRDIQPKTPSASETLAMDVVLKYADTIEMSLGVDAAAKTLDDLMAKLRAEDPKDVARKRLDYTKKLVSKMKEPPKQTKSDEELLALYEERANDQTLNRKLDIVTKKAHLLAFSGRTDEALKTVDAFSAQLPPNSKVVKSASNLKSTISLFGKPIPEIKYQGSLGEFTNLAALKGKVVVLDFSHTPGRTAWGYGETQLRKFYDESHAKGLEIVSVVDASDIAFTYGPAQALATVEQRVKDAKVPWPVIYGEMGDLRKRPSNSPKMILLDRKGNVRAVVDSMSQWMVTHEYEDFQRQIERLLKE